MVEKQYAEVTKKYLHCAKITDSALRVIEHHYGGEEFDTGSPLCMIIFQDALNEMNQRSRKE